MSGAALSGPAARADLRYALHAEWTKLRTVASTYWLLLAAVALTIAVGAAAAAAFGCPAGGCAPARTGADPAKISLTGLYLGQAVVAVLAVLAIGDEYGTGMIRVTLAAVPRRLTVLAAKAAVVTGGVLAAGVVAVGGSVLAGRLILPGRGLSAFNGYPPLSLGHGPDLRAAAGSVLYLALIALLALGVTTAIRDAAASIGVVLGLLYLFPLITAVIPDHVLARHLEQVAPMTAGLYIAVTAGVRSLPLTPWQGLGVLAAWTAAALLLGALVLRLRDALPWAEQPAGPGRTGPVPGGDGRAGGTQAGPGPTAVPKRAFSRLPVPRARFTAIGDRTRDHGGWSRAGKGDDLASRREVRGRAGKAVLRHLGRRRALCGAGRPLAGISCWLGAGLDAVH